MTEKPLEWLQEENERNLEDREESGEEERIRQIWIQVEHTCTNLLLKPIYSPDTSSNFGL